MKISWLAGLVLAGVILFSSSAWATTFIVKDGRPNAEIVIAAHPLRMVKLAALELQHYIEKISGARLPIVADPGTNFPVKIYVGRSAYTDKIGETARPGSPQAGEGLKYGAFRMVSGEDYLILLGHDFNFAPRAPWARSHGDIPRAQAEWDKLTGATWVLPEHSVYKQHNLQMGIWLDDEGGTLNAVYEFLRSLGVRWYMPGELGEVVPEIKTIPLPAANRTVKPDFNCRVQDIGNYANYTRDDVMWGLRLGLNHYRPCGPHGMIEVHGRKEMQAAHPEYYALVSGQRDTKFRGTGHACFSSEGLFRETVNYARAALDHFDLPAVSIMPQDGYHHCQCDRCRDQDPSELVWGFFNRVAAELNKTHPDRLVVGGAYGAYRTPPKTISSFGSNVAVRISWPRTGLDVPELWQEYRDLVEAWRVKLAPGRLIRNANNLATSTQDAKTPVIFPVIFTRGIAKDLGFLKGISMGDRSSVPRSPDQYWQHPGINHLNIYLLSRCLWKADLDLEELLDEYYTLFYGPARKEMRAAFEFAEATYPRDGPTTPSRVPIEDRIRFVEMLHRARAAAGDTVYGRRIQLIIDEFQPLAELRSLATMAKKRGEVIEFPYLMPFDDDKWREAAGTIRMDGRLDEPFWTVYSGAGGLEDSQTGGNPGFRTSFRMRWYKNNLYVGIRCDGPEGDELNIAATRNDDPAIRDGYYVTLLMETDTHSYYEIAVSPAGAVLDLDLEAGTNLQWASQAEVFTHAGVGFWSVEARIPVLERNEDPLHGITGRTPSRSFPWHFNVCRQRLRETGGEWSAWAPTGGREFHDKLKFGRLFLRHSK